MDIFNSALKNPVPPIRKDGEESISVPPSGETSAPELSVQKKKKNSRRKHRNSHLGCGTCKKRRIKCDENLPSCLNCLKGKLHCAYLNLDPPARNALRMAQFNQNLRQDRVGESDLPTQQNPLASSNSTNNSNNNSPMSKMQTNVSPVTNTSNPVSVQLPVQVPTVVPVGNSSSPPGMVSQQQPANTPMDFYTAQAVQMQAAQAAAAAAGAAPFPVPYPIIQVPPSGATHIVQSPYGPVAVQAIPGPPPPPGVSSGSYPIQLAPQIVYSQPPPPPPGPPQMMPQAPNMMPGVSISAPATAPPSSVAIDQKLTMDGLSMEKVSSINSEPPRPPLELPNMPSSESTLPLPSSDPKQNPLVSSDPVQNSLSTNSMSTTSVPSVSPHISKNHLLTSLPSAVRSSETSPVLPPIKLKVESEEEDSKTSEVRVKSETPESQDDIKLPPIKSLHVTPRDEQGEKVPTISKLLS